MPLAILKVEKSNPGIRCMYKTVVNIPKFCSNNVLIQFDEPKLQPTVESVAKPDVSHSEGGTQSGDFGGRHPMAQ
jgi:hypothetical protein